MAYIYHCLLPVDDIVEVMSCDDTEYIYRCSKTQCQLVKPYFDNLEHIHRKYSIHIHVCMYACICMNEYPLIDIFKNNF